VCSCFLLARFLHNRPFFDAVREGNTGVVKELLSKNPALIHARTIGIWQNDTALHLAAGAGNNKMVNLLLDRGADVNAKDDASIAPLHLAALHGDASVAETLLMAGANVNETGFKDNNTPLSVAASNGRLNVVRVLLAHGADIKAVDKFGKTALQYAQENHHTNVADILSK
jgi:cytohesin